jgi:BirA family biotin operon repressor/biotin-[acetyl-CoA-carboxylase] ligase
MAGVRTVPSMQQAAANTLTFAVLRRLADGEFHSGTDIAAELGFSRSRIWQALAHCADLGVEVFRVPGRGYRLATPLTLLDGQAVLARRQRTDWHVEVVSAVDSTNSALMRAASERDVHAVAQAAEVQHAGRGRLGRSWVSMLGASLTFSLAWRFAQGVSELSGLSLAVGLAVAQALEREGVTDLRLKWPNDLLLSGAKCGGILIDVQGDALGPTLAVIGIGLNLRGAEVIAGRVGQETADLATAGLAAPDRNALLASLLDALAATLERFASAGFAPFREEWNRRDAFRGSGAVLSGGASRPVEGREQGVDETGALLLETPVGLRRFVSGELSLRAAEPRPASSQDAA